MLWRRRSRSASSASAMLRVMSPSWLPGQDARAGALVRVREEIEGQSLRVDGPRPEREAEAHQRVEETALGASRSPPAREVRRVGQVRDRSGCGCTRRSSAEAAPPSISQLHASCSALAQKRNRRSGAASARHRPAGGFERAERCFLRQVAERAGRSSRSACSRSRAAARRPGIRRASSRPIHHVAAGRERGTPCKDDAQHRRRSPPIGDACGEPEGAVPRPP